MPQVVTVREAVQRAKADGFPVSEYTLRQWLKTGAIPARSIGKKLLLFYPNLISYLTCAGDSKQEPAAQTAAIIRRIET